MHGNPVVAGNEVHGRGSSKHLALMDQMARDGIHDIQVQPSFVLRHHSKHVGVDVLVQDAGIPLDVHRHMIPLPVLWCRGSEDLLAQGSKLHVPNVNQLIRPLCSLLGNYEALHDLVGCVDFVVVEMPGGLLKFVRVFGEGVKPALAVNQHNGMRLHRLPFVWKRCNSSNVGVRHCVLMKDFACQGIQPQHLLGAALPGSDHYQLCMRGGTRRKELHPRCAGIDGAAVPGRGCAGCVRWSQELCPHHLRGRGLQCEDFRRAGQGQDKLVSSKIPKLLAAARHASVRQKEARVCPLPAF
mmetsp:Transcript_28720/g.66590  ORF Transcript_28720/g.66590 Transcript_28720/m.66590 type:complete len:298 (-) Transcript_28720:696-1589(-)